MKQKRPVTGLLIALVVASVCLVIYWGTQTARADELASLMMGAFFYASAALVAVILYYGYRVKQADRMAAMGQQSAVELSAALLERYESVYLVREDGSFTEYGADAGGRLQVLGRGEDFPAEVPEERRAEEKRLVLTRTEP